MAKAYLTQQESKRFVGQFWTVEDLIELAMGEDGDVWGLYQRNEKTEFCGPRKGWQLQASLNTLLKWCREMHGNFIPGRIIICYGTELGTNDLVIMPTMLYSEESEPQNILTTRPTTWYKEGHFNC